MAVIGAAVLRLRQGGFMNELRRKYCVLVVVAVVAIGFAYGAAWFAEQLVKRLRPRGAGSPTAVLPPLPADAVGSNNAVRPDLAGAPASQ